MINDLKSSGQIINTKFWCDMFSGFDKVALYWTFLFLYSFCIVPFVQLINYSARQYKTINYYLAFSIYFLFQASAYVIVCFMVLQSEFMLPCRFMLGCEAVRLSLKVHGYFREKMLYGLKEFHMEYAVFSPYKNVSEEEVCPEIRIRDLVCELRKFLYYLFCPSLIYRDAYPQISHYRWNLILGHMCNFVLCILSYYILVRYICDPYFNFSKIKDYYSLPHFIYDSLRFAIPGVSFLLIGFFLLLHSWLNLWSELLRHGDRRFYEDWWNCTNFEEYYRKWNMVVHEWLYYYVYNDVLRLSLGRSSRLHAKMAVFALSVVVHEVIMWFAMGFFFPILSLFFGGPGILLTYIKPQKKEFNIVFWSKLFLGKGLILVLYLREFNVRFVLDQVGLIEPWHSWVPRSFLIYLDSYKNLIQSSKFY